MTETIHHDGLSTPGPIAKHSQKPSGKRRNVRAATVESAAFCPDAHHDDAAILQRLLQMADRYAREGNRRQALDLLWRVLQHPSCGQHARAAKRAVMVIARTYESEGSRHMALDLLEKLLNV